MIYGQSDFTVNAGSAFENLGNRDSSPLLPSATVDSETKVRDDLRVRS